MSLWCLTHGHFYRIHDLMSLKQCLLCHNVDESY